MNGVRLHNFTIAGLRILFRKMSCYCEIVKPDPIREDLKQ